MYRQQRTKAKHLAASFLRTSSASAAAELVGAVLILVPLLLFAINIGYLCVGSFINDAACREAANAASKQTSADSANAAANAAIQGFASGLIVPQITNVQFHYVLEDPSDPGNSPAVNLMDVFQENPTTQQPNSITDAPSVTVSTQLNVQMPAPLLFTANGLKSAVVLSSTYQYPIIYPVNTLPPDACDSTDCGLPGDGTSGYPVPLDPNNWPPPAFNTGN